MWTFGGADASIVSTWFGLRHARLKAVVLQPTVVLSFGSFVFRSSFSSASFSKLPPLLLFFLRAAGGYRHKDGGAQFQYLWEGGA